MRFLAVSLFSLLSTHALLAQDYLITTKGDTLKGSIIFQLNTKIESATVKGKKRETISAVGTREVMIKGKRFKPVQFNGSILFMEILTDGYLSLLAFQPPNIMSYDGRLLQKRDGKLLEVPTFGFKKNMSTYLGDYPDLAAKIKEGELDSRELNEIISRYNNFIYENTGASRTEGEIDTQQQQKKIALIDSLKSEIERSTLPSKQDALDILNELTEKIKSGKPALPYMIKSLNTTLESRQDLLDKLNQITGN